MRISFKQGNPFRLLFAASRREESLARYVVREHGRGRSLDDVLNDPHVRNWSTPEERARLLERPEVVAAIGRQSLTDLRGTATHHPLSQAR
jgi:hypothetical protein